VGRSSEEHLKKSEESLFKEKSRRTSESLFGKKSRRTSEEGWSPPLCGVRFAQLWREIYL